MIRAISLTSRWLLVLLQLIAPWVHAHTGAETGGFLHVPGLEHLLRSADPVAAGAVTSAGATDVIVGVQAGIGQENLCPDETPAVSPRPFNGSARPEPIPLLLIWARPPPIRLRSALLTGSPPRASPV